jgi:hypothetical protein
MKAILNLAGALLLATGVSAWAADNPAPATTSSHTQESMVAGSHMMPAQKQHHMSDRVMPSRSHNCTDEALSKMPPEHRAACRK